jgi:hypothetical protein
MGFTTHAHQSGLLANAVFNRDILPGRVEEYAAEMEAGNWRDLLSDPITITEDGQVVNGQHRLAAASGVDWDKVENDPAFLVVFGVDPTEAPYADGSSRTGRGERVIRDKLLRAINPEPKNGKAFEHRSFVSPAKSFLVESW